MTADYNTMPLDDLRRHVLAHRGDRAAFEIYIDRSKASGRMITIDPSRAGWDSKLDADIRAARCNNES